MKNKLLAGVLILSVFLSCKSQENNHELFYFEKNYVELENDNTIEEISKENFVCQFNKLKDSIVINKIDKSKSSLKSMFITSQVLDPNTRIFFNSHFDESVKVSFSSPNKVLVNNDLYFLNESFFNHLLSNVNKNGSIVDLVYLIKDSYGNYSDFFSPLINLNLASVNNQFKIKKVIVSSINFQTPEESIVKSEIIYNIDESVRGDFFNKELTENNLRHKIYNITSGNERVDISKKIYYNKKTKLDSIVGSWSLYSNSIQHNFREYYKKNDIRKTDSFIYDIKTIKSVLELE